MEGMVEYSISLPALFSLCDKGKQKNKSKLKLDVWERRGLVVGASDIVIRPGFESCSDLSCPLSVAGEKRDSLFSRRAEEEARRSSRTGLDYALTTWICFTSLASHQLGFLTCFAQFVYLFH